MKQHMTKLLTALFLLILIIPQVTAQQADSTDKSLDEEFFIIETRHRLYPDFSQIDTVAMNEPFLIGEEEYRGEVIAFNPHLGITTKGEALQMSDTLYNPAARVKLEYDGEVKQENWAFFVLSSPHFRRDDLLAFRLVDFKVSDKYIEAPARK